MKQTEEFKYPDTLLESAVSYLSALIEFPHIFCGRSSSNAQRQIYNLAEKTNKQMPEAIALSKGQGRKLYFPDVNTRYHFHHAIKRPNEGAPTLHFFEDYFDSGAKIATIHDQWKNRFEIECRFTVMVGKSKLDLPYVTTIAILPELAMLIHEFYN